jgi:cellulose synthase/poly-beta-1,6-N-acetylglucosamine synthase-like glycosyltransferase
MLIDLALSAFIVLTGLFLTAIAGGTLWWQLHAWRTPEIHAGTEFRSPDSDSELSFSLLIPARHEQAVLAATVKSVLASTHTDFEVIIIVGHDDPETSDVAYLLAEQYPGLVSVVVDTHEVKNKPKALNSALPQCRGEIIGIFDAEDQVHPELLDHVDHALRETGAEVVQGGVQLINFQSSWYALRNCLEYFFWFHSRLHLHAKRGFIPLGGNTVFVRASTLRENGGWDSECLTEDCDLGVRLSSRGVKVVVAYGADLVTREETPGSIKALIKQRTRWNQGFLQVYRKAEWREIPDLGRRLLARWTLVTPFAQAFTGLLIPLDILVALVGRVPISIALISFLPVLPTLGTFAFETVALHEFGRLYGLRVRVRDYVRLIVGGPFYQVLLALAALRAVWRDRRGEGGWELTQHVGAHLDAEDRGMGGGPVPDAV